MRILHVIHDFLPRHQAGSEIYAAELCRALSTRHHVTVLCAEFDPGRPQGHVTWRVHDGLPIVEVVNNWKCRSFEDTYRPPDITHQLGHVLQALQPEVVHVHNLLNLSFDLPRIARSRGAAVVATLHDYTLVCPSGGQRLHRADGHVCVEIDPERCVRCFRASPFHAQLTFEQVASSVGLPLRFRQGAAALARRVPGTAALFLRAGSRVGPSLTRDDVERRLEAARGVFADIDAFIAPSPFIGDEYVRLGVPREKIRNADYGFSRSIAARRRDNRGPLRIGYVGTIVWHKGIHVLLDAVRALPATDVEVHVHGDTGVFPEYFETLRASSMGNVRFHGRFERNQLDEVYGSMDVLVVPSLWLENSPLVVHEAFMAGLPVVAARIGGLVDLVTDGVNGLVYDPGSAADLAGVLRSIIEDRGMLARLAANVPRVRTLDEDAMECETLYRALLSERRQLTPSMERKGFSRAKH